MWYSFVGYISILLRQDLLSCLYEPSESHSIDKAILQFSDIIRSQVKILLTENACVGNNIV